MAYSTIQQMHKRKEEEQALVRGLMKRALATRDTTYTTGKAGRGSGQDVLVLGGTGYIGRALVTELAERGYKPVLLARHVQAKELYPQTEVVIGEVSRKADVEKVFDAFPVEAVITLLSSRRPNDEEECRRVDYQSNINAIQVGAVRGLKHFIHISDSGCYRPELLPQVYKLQVEGELMGRFHGQVLTCCDVIGRLFRFPILGTYEIVGFLGAAAASLATAYTTVHRGHVSVSLIVARLSPKVQFIVFIIAHLLSMMLFAFLTVECVRYGNELKSSGELSMTLEWPLHPLLYGMSFSFLIVCAVLWVEFYDVLTKRKRPWS